MLRLFCLMHFNACTLTPISTEHVHESCYDLKSCSSETVMERERERATERGLRFETGLSLIRISYKYTL